MEEVKAQRRVRFFYAWKLIKDFSPLYVKDLQTQWKVVDDARLPSGLFCAWKKGEQRNDLDIVKPTLYNEAM